MKFFLLILIGLCLTLHAEENSHVHLDENQCQPGTFFPLTININKPSNDIELILPQDWRVLPTIPSSSMDIQLIPLAIMVPADCPAGEYEIILSLKQDNELITEKVFVNVAARIDFHASFLKQNDLVGAGEIYTINIQMENNGNTALPLELETVANPFCDLQIIEFPNEMLPGQTTNAQIQVYLPHNVCSCFQQSIFFKIRSCLNDEILFQDAVVLEVFPSYFVKIDPYVRIPSYQRYALAGQKGKTVAVAEWGGKGEIDPIRGRNLEYLFRVPSNSHNVNYELYQQFYARLYQYNWDAVAGDTFYKLTPLTERGYYARGGGFSYTPGTWEIGTYYSRSPFYTHNKLTEWGSFLEFTPRESFEVSTNYLYRKYSRFKASNICTLELDLYWKNNNILSIEAGRDFTYNQHQNAFRVEWTGSTDNHFFYNIEKYRAERQFFGYYNDMDLLSGGISAPLKTALLLILSASNYKQNLDKIMVQEWSSALRQKQFTGQLLYSFSNGWSITATSFILKAKDVMPIPQYNFDQRWGGFNIGYSTPKFNIFATSEFGQQKDYLTHSTTKGLQRYTGNFSWNLTQKLTWNGIFESGHTNYYDAGPWRNGIGTSLRYRFQPGSWTEILAYTSRNNPDRNRFNHFSFKLSYLNRWGHIFYSEAQSFTFNHHTFKDHVFKRNIFPNQYLFLISYTIPFDAPVGKRCDIGSLYGSVIHNDLPISKSIVTIGGQKILTDTSGRFCIPCLSPGTYTVSTDLLPSHLIPTENTPEYIDVYGGKKQYLEIELIDKCKIVGDVYLFKKELDHITLDSGFGGARIYLQSENMKEVYSTMSNAKGHFYFNDLKPGLWKVTIDTDLDKTHYEPEPTSLTLNLKSSEEKSCIFKLNPISYPILPLE